MHLPSYHCVLYVQQEEESLMHMFFECPFSQACWIYLGVRWDLNLPPLDIVIDSIERFGSSIYREVTTIVAWSIW